MYVCVCFFWQFLLQVWSWVIESGVLLMGLPPPPPPPPPSFVISSFLFCIFMWRMILTNAFHITKFCLTKF